MQDPITLTYGQLSPFQILDFYPAKQTDHLSPLIILVHGGAFAFGDQKMPYLLPIIDQAHQAGFAVASIDYRKSDEAIFPGALADTKAAVRYLKAHANHYHLDPDSFTIWGESAGGYLALMTALTPNVNVLNGDMPDYMDQSSQVANLVCFYPPVDFFKMKEQCRSLGNLHAGDGRFESAFLGVEDIYHSQTACATSYWQSYRNQ